MRAPSLASLAVGGLGIVVAAVALTTGVLAQGNGTPKDVVSTYNYDAEEERWVKTVKSEPVPDIPDGPVRKGSNTIVIQLDENNPVKEIVIEEALVIGGTEPLLEINGSAVAPATGKINIGTLAMLTVEAKQLEIDADVVRTDISNVVAKDNELDLELNAVNVVSTMRGAASSLFIGVNREDREYRLEISKTINDVNLSRGGATRENGIRADRIRILGPSSGTAFVELLIVKQSGVMGKIDVDKVAIQDLILHRVSLDDGV